MARLLKDEPARKKQVYVMIGHEPFAQCMDRIRDVIGWGCEPHVQPIMKLNALEEAAVGAARLDRGASATSRAGRIAITGATPTSPDMTASARSKPRRFEQAERLFA
jgi:hypothetical protein